MMITNSLGMLRRLFLSSFTVPFLLLLIPVTCKSIINHRCHSSCGDELDISYPFRLKTDPKECGLGWFELTCKNNRTILQIHSGIYYVEEINYNFSTIRIVDAGLNKDDCSVLPLHSLTHRNFSGRNMYRISHRNRPINFISCTTPLTFTPFVDTEFCSDNNSNSLLLTSPQKQTFVVNNPVRVSDMEDSCSISMVVWASSYGLKTRNTSFSPIHEQLLHGTELSWYHNCYLEILTSLLPCGKINLALIRVYFFFLVQLPYYSDTVHWLDNVDFLCLFYSTTMGENPFSNSKCFLLL